MAQSTTQPTQAEDSPPDLGGNPFADALQTGQPAPESVPDPGERMSAKPSAPAPGKEPEKEDFVFPNISDESPEEQPRETEDTSSKSDEDLLAARSNDGLTKPEQNRRRKLMRDQIKDLNARLAETTQSLEDRESDYSSQVSELNSTIEELRTELNEIRGSAMQQALPQYSPDDDPDIRALLDKQAREITRMNRRAPGFESQAISLASELYRVQQANDPEALREFESRVEERFGNSSQSVMDTLYDVIDIQIEARGVEDKNRAGYSDRVVENYRTVRSDFEKELSVIGNASEADLAEDPTSINAILTHAVRQSPEFAKRIQEINRTATAMFAGMEPVSSKTRWREYLNGDGQLNPEGMRKYMEEVKTLKTLQRQLVPQWASLQAAAILLPKAIKRAADLEKRLGEQRSTEPVHHPDASDNPAPGESRSVNVEVDDPASLANPFLSGGNF